MALLSLPTIYWFAWEVFGFGISFIVVLDCARLLGRLEKYLYPESGLDPYEHARWQQEQARRAREQQASRRALQRQGVRIMLLNSLMPMVGLQEWKEDCPVCMETVKGPYRTRCGHVFCVECLREWVWAGRKMNCPMCRTPLVGGVGLEEEESEQEEYEEYEDESEESYDGDEIEYANDNLSNGESEDVNEDLDDGLSDSTRDSLSDDSKQETKNDIADGPDLDLGRSKDGPEIDPEIEHAGQDTETPEVSFRTTGTPILSSLREFGLNESDEAAPETTNEARGARTAEWIRSVTDEESSDRDESRPKCPP